MGLIKGLNTSNNSSEAATKNAVSSLFSLNTNIPVGVILPYAIITPPTGFLICNGASLNTYSYKELHAAISNNFGGTAYQLGVTDQPSAVTTFNVPNFTLSSVFPIGLDSTNTKINALGKSGGNLDHTHTAPNHEHNFTHSHSVQSHNHGYDHTHGMGNHVHNTNHRHYQSHSHTLPAHGHTNISLTVTLPDPPYHYHDVSSSYADNAGTSKIGRAAANESYFNSNGDIDPSGNKTMVLYSDLAGNPSTWTDWISLSSSTVGYYYGTDASVNGLSTGSSGAYTTENDPGSGAPSINTTSSVTNINSYPLSSSSTTTSTQSNSLTGTAGVSLTTNSSNPPYLTINFIIKAVNG